MNSQSFGYLLAFVSMIIGSLSNFPFTDAARKWGPVAINHFRLIVGFITLSIVCMLVDKQSPIELFTSPTLSEYLFLGSSGIIGLALGDYFGFHSMAILGAKRSSIFNTMAPGAALFFGYIIVGENLSITGIIGLVISVIGMIWFIEASNTRELDKHSVHEYGKVSKGILFGVLSGLCQGFHMSLSKRGLTPPSPFEGARGHISFTHATWIRVFVAGAAYCLFTYVTGRFKRDVVTPIMAEKTIIKKAILASILGLVFSILLVMWCITLCKVAVAQTILSLGPIILLPAAYFLYGEKITYKTLAAAGVSILGVAVLIWREEIALLFN